MSAAVSMVHEGHTMKGQRDCTTGHAARYLTSVVRARVSSPYSTPTRVVSLHSITLVFSSTFRAAVRPDVFLSFHPFRSCSPPCNVVHPVCCREDPSRPKR